MKGTTPNTASVSRSISDVSSREWLEEFLNNRCRFSIHLSWFEGTEMNVEMCLKSATREKTGYEHGDWCTGSSHSTTNQLC